MLQRDALLRPLCVCVPYTGVLLSGGLDSSLVAAIASRVLARGDQKNVWGKLHSFCIGLQGSPDLKAGRQVADFLGTDHHEFTFTVQVCHTRHTYLAHA